MGRAPVSVLEYRIILKRGTDTQGFEQPSQLLDICIVLPLAAPTYTNCAGCQNVRNTCVCNIALFIRRERIQLTVSFVRKANENTVSRYTYFSARLTAVAATRCNFANIRANSHCVLKHRVGRPGVAAHTLQHSSYMEQRPLCCATVLTFHLKYKKSLAAELEGSTLLIPKRRFQWSRGLRRTH